MSLKIGSSTSPKSSAIKLNKTSSNDFSVDKNTNIPIRDILGIMKLLKVYNGP